MYLFLLEPVKNAVHIKIFILISSHPRAHSTHKEGSSHLQPSRRIWYFLLPLCFVEFICPAALLMEKVDTFPTLSLGLWPHTQCESWFALAVISSGHADIMTSLDSSPNRGIGKVTSLLLWFSQMSPMYQMFSSIAHWLSGLEISGAWWWSQRGLLLFFLFPFIKAPCLVSALTGLS